MKVGGFFHIWVYLQASPLMGIAATLIAYEAGLLIARWSRGHTLANPSLLAMAMLIALLLLTGTSYERYFEGAKFVHFLLGPATVALALPIYTNLQRIRRAGPAILVALLVGSIVASGSAMLIAAGLGASPKVILSIAPKSVTSPIAMGVAERIGGDPSLAAAFVMLTGILGTILVQMVMRCSRITDWRAHGLAAGTAGHGLATARVLMVNETAGAFGGIAIGLNGIATSILVPILVRALSFLF